MPGTLTGPCHLPPTSGAPAPHSTHPRLGVRPPAQPHCPPQRSPLGSPPAHTLARARRRRPRRERRSRRNRRAASGTSTARSCRSRLWDRDRTSRSCEGTDGQVDGQMGGERQREDTQMDGRTERRKGWRRGGGAGEPMDPLGQAWPPTGRHGEHCLRSGSHLFQALHVLEVEANVEEAQVGIDELELREADGRSLCHPIPRSPHCAPPAGHHSPGRP